MMIRNTGTGKTPRVLARAGADFELGSRHRAGAFLGQREVVGLRSRRPGRHGRGDLGRLEGLAGLLLGGEDAHEQPPAALDGDALVLQRVAGEDHRGAGAGARVEGRLQHAREEARAPAVEVAPRRRDEQQDGHALLAAVRVLFQAPLALVARIVDDDERARHVEFQGDVGRQLEGGPPRRALERLAYLVLRALRQRGHHDVLRRQAHAPVRRAALVEGLGDRLRRAVAGVGAEHVLDLEDGGRLGVGQLDQLDGLVLGRGRLVLVAHATHGAVAARKLGSVVVSGCYSDLWYDGVSLGLYCGLEHCAHESGPA
mmetsp:Transcript_1264/g.3814  ORF Transcript_1264/g.3814 Transcript_1264/m.3814 type:complete len:314 (+) Transcript_1264:20-961(+)